MNACLEPQPAPKDGGVVVGEFALEAVRDRIAQGYEKYGVYLCTDNGRNALTDTIQELLDGLFYSIQLREELAATKRTLDFAIMDIECGRALGGSLRKETVDSVLNSLHEIQEKSFWL